MTKGFPHFTKVAMIMGDHTARGGEAFRPGETAPPPPPDEDGDDDADDAEHASESIALVHPAAQAAITASVHATVAMSTSYASHGSTLSTSSKPATSTLVDGTHPSDKMDIDDIQEVDKSRFPSGSPASTPPASATAETSQNKRKIRSPSEPEPSIASIAPSSSSCLTGSSHAGKPPSSSKGKKSATGGSKRQKSVTESSRGSRLAAGKMPAQRTAAPKGRGGQGHLDDFNASVNRMADLMESQNLILQVPVQDPVAQACARVVVTIQEDQMGGFTVVEKGKIISYLLTNPSAAQTFEVLTDDDVRYAWLRSSAL